MKRFLFLLILPLLLWSASTALAAPPAPPHAIEGAVAVDGIAPDNGTEVIVIVTHSATETVTFTTTTFANGFYSIELPADDTDTAAHDGGIDGDAITFAVAGNAADQTATFASRTVTRLDLTVAAAHSVDVDEEGELNIELITPKDSIENKLTMTISGTNLLIQDPDSNLPDGENSITVPLDSVTGDIVITGSEADDLLIINETNGALPSGTVIRFDGEGEETEKGDELIVKTAVGSSRRLLVRVQHANTSDGTIELDDGARIDFTGLEPVTVLGTPDDVRIGLPTTNDIATLSNVGSGQSLLAGATFEDTTFSNPLEGGLFEIALGDGDDELVIDSAEFLTNTRIIINGGGGSDSVQYNATARLVTGTMTLTIGTDNLTFAPTAVYAAALGTIHDQIIISETATITLSGATLDLGPQAGFTPTGGDSFTLIDNQSGASSFVGTFDGLAEGATVTLGGVAMTLSYAGGDGNDVVLSAPNLVVSTLTDESDGNHSVGDNSLREAVVQAQDGDTITFDASIANGTIIMSDTLATIKVINDVTISSTVPITLSGGGTTKVLILGDSAAATVAIHNVTVANGYSDGAQGAGIELANGHLTLVDSVVRDNVLESAATGAGLSIVAGSSAEISNTTFLNNSATDSSATAGGGGAIGNDGTLAINASTFMTNTAGGDEAGGGAIVNFGTLTVTSSTFAYNVADDTFFGGGAISNGGGAFVVNSSFGGNSADFSYGGAIGNDLNLTVHNSTFSGNVADEGGAIATFGTSTINTSILANSSSSDCYFDGEFGVAVSGANNIIETDATGADACATTSTISADPALSALADKGGDTQTFALQATSPAIDRGGSSCTVMVDQRGNPRSDLGCDLGAFEMVIADSSIVTQQVVSGTTTTFGPTQISIGVADDGGCLTGVSATFLDQSHPNAPTGELTAEGRYWTLDALGCPSGFAITLTLPALAEPSAATRVCRFANSLWGCVAPTSVTTNTVTLSNVSQFSDWAIAIESPTVATLAQFTSNVNGIESVELSWETELETETVGFRIYRTQVGVDGEIRINTELIGATGTGGKGSRYQLTDASVGVGQYTYRLVAVNTSAAETTLDSLNVAITTPTAVSLGATNSATANAPQLATFTLLLTLSVCVLWRRQTRAC